MSNKQRLSIFSLLLVFTFAASYAEQTIIKREFNDLNGNGKMDPGEPGIPNFAITMKTRENSVMDRGAVTVTTDANGYYWQENAYPITQWLVEEAYADGFQTTGVTYQADNQPAETTILGQGVDVNIHPVIFFRKVVFG